MHVKLARTYPVPVHDAFAFFMDIKSWADWTTLEVLNPEASAWEHPGDIISFTRKRSLSGLPMRGDIALDEVKTNELVRMTLRSPGVLPEIPVECRFVAAGAGALTLTLAVDTEDPPGFVWGALERLAFLENLIVRDMHRCLDGLERSLDTTLVN